MIGAIISIVSLLVGTFFGILFMALCIAGKSKNIMTNADRLALDTGQLADLIYRADDVGTEICQVGYDKHGDYISCRYPDEDNGCIKCIKDWLEKEIDEECKE